VLPDAVTVDGLQSPASTAGIVFGGVESRPRSFPTRPAHRECGRLGSSSCWSATGDRQQYRDVHVHRPGREVSKKGARARLEVNMSFLIVLPEGKTSRYPARCSSR
jgi:hypothetical protein